MTINQEEALYDFLDNADRIFDLDEVVRYINKAASGQINRLSMEVEAFINLRNLAFTAGKRRWVSRRGCFEKLPFVISPTRLELVNGILIPGHRCVPFANIGLLPQEYAFFWQGSAIPFTTTEGPPEEFYPYYSVFGEEYAPQYVARDNSENEAAFNEDPYDDPPEVSIKTLDMRGIYREAAFVPGDRFLVKTLDWKKGEFGLEKVGQNEWAQEDLDKWLTSAESGFEDSFEKMGPASCTEEQIAYAYWYGPSRMREVPAYALEDYLYEKTEKVEIAAFGIESRFWYAGREIPDQKELDTGSIRPDITPVEAILYNLRIPASEYVVQSYVRDSLYREDGDVDLIMERLIPARVNIDSLDRDFITEYVESVLEDFREFYNLFTDKAMGPIRQRAGELHTAVIDLAARLTKGEIDLAWLPRHTFVVLSQIQNHTANVMEDLDADESPPDAELEALDGSLDSMIETYEDLKELIEEAMDSFRRNKLAVVRPGSASGTVNERLLQLSIGGADIWRRIIIPDTCTLAELHEIIQSVFKWRNTQAYKFRTEKIQEMESDTKIEALEAGDINEMLYEYGTRWAVRVMILSAYETHGLRPVRCVAGAGAPPPESIDGPLKFKRALIALESGNDLERLSARQQLGLEFVPDEFNLEACNRNLNARFQSKGDK